jgi:hypothetical protein
MKYTRIRCSFSLLLQQQRKQAHRDHRGRVDSDTDVVRVALERDG